MSDRKIVETYGNKGRDCLKRRYDAVWSEGPALPATPEESEAREMVESMWSMGLLDVRPWVQPVDTDAIGIAWMTSAPATGMVEWTQEEGEDATWRRAGYSEDGLRSVDDTMQRAVIRGYDQTKPLLFRLCSRPLVAFQRSNIEIGDEVRSEIYRIKPVSTPRGKVSIAVFNDTHNRPQNVPILLDAAGEGIDLAIFNGDIIANPMNVTETITDLLLPMAWMTSQSIPVLYLRGNHESMGRYARHLKQHLCLQKNRYYGAMNIGAARIIYLDSGTFGPDNDIFGYQDLIDEECEWLAGEVASEAYRSATWRIVILHAPPDWRHAGEAWGLDCNRQATNRFAPLLDVCPPHAVIAGHTHEAELLPPSPDPSIGFQFPVFIGGGPDLTRATAIRIDVDADSLAIAILAPDGTPIASRRW